MPNPLKQAFDFRFDDTIRRAAADDDETKNVDFMLSRGTHVSPNQEGVEAGLKTTKKFVLPDHATPRSEMSEAKPKASKSKTVLSGSSAASPEKPKAADRKLTRMSLERTANGHIKATHRYSPGGDNPGDGEEIHALAPNDVLSHLGEHLGISRADTKE